MRNITINDIYSEWAWFIRVPMRDVEITEYYNKWRFAQLERILKYKCKWEK